MMTTNADGGTSVEYLEAVRDRERSLRAKAVAKAVGILNDALDAGLEELTPVGLGELRRWMGAARRHADRIALLGELIRGVDHSR